MFANLSLFSFRYKGTLNNWDFGSQSRRVWRCIQRLPALLSRSVVLVVFCVFPFLVSAGQFDNSHLIADAANGDPEAQYTLAHLNLKGRGGIDRNVQAGIGLLEQAVAGGHKEAGLDLALLYLNGISVEEDNVEALRWFKKAAELGQVDAQYYLGLAYKSIDGAEARRWLKMGADNGHAEAAAELDTICSEDPDLCR